MNLSLIVLSFVALASVTLADNSYLIISPKLFKVNYQNQLSVFIANGFEPVEVQFGLTIDGKRIDFKTVCKAGETRNVTLSLPKEFPVGPGQLTVIGTGGLKFEENRDVIIYDNRHVILVQTSASSYQPQDTMQIRVLATNENLIPIENGELNIEIYDATLKLVGEFSRVPIRSGLTETLQYPIADYVNIGTWLVTATMDNTTSSVQVLVSRPIIPLFDLKAIFPRFILRTDKFLRGVLEMNDNRNEPIFGRATIAIGSITDQTLEMKNKKPSTDEWRQWKSQTIDIVGRFEFNYDLGSQFNVDINKVLAIKAYIQAIDPISGQERVIHHLIPVFTHEIMYDIRPLEFEAGINNEFEIIAKRPDGKPAKMDDMIVSIKMFIGNEQGKQQDEKTIEIKDFYTRGRNDVGLFNFEIPDNCIGVLMTMTPIDGTGKFLSYRTQAIPLLPTPRRRDAKLSIELLPSKIAPLNTDVNVPVISSQISTVGRTSNFYIQLVPSKSVEKFERLPMSYVLMTNGRIILTGEFYLEPTKECQTERNVRTIRPEEQKSPKCLFNNTLPIYITREMVPYSTLLVYTFQSKFGFNVVESYRFSVAGLFQSSLTLNSTVVPYTPTEILVDDYKYIGNRGVEPVRISDKVQDRSRIELSFTGVPNSVVGLNVFEYDSVLHGLSNEITKERLLKYLTMYEQIPMHQMPVDSSSTMQKTTTQNGKVERTISETQEEELINRERTAYRVRYPIEQTVFGVSSSQPLPIVEGDDIYTTSSMGRLYGEERTRSGTSHYRRKLEKSLNQYDVTVDDNTNTVASSIPLILTADLSPKSMGPSVNQKLNDEIQLKGEKTPLYEKSIEFGTSTWYEKYHSKLNSISQEAFAFMHSGLAVISDFSSLHVPHEMKYENFTILFSKFRQQRENNYGDQSFSNRDQVRQLFEEYLVKTDLSMIPPPIMFEELSLTGYYRSIFFNTTNIESQGTGKVLLPRTKPYSTWLASGFALNSRSGLSIAQPIRLSTSEGLFVLANCPKQMKTGEHALLTYGINNYLGRDLSNVQLRIRASADFYLFEQSKPEQILSNKDKDYSITIPSLKANAVETRNLVLVPKRTGLMQITIEVESEFGGDYEILNLFVFEADLKHTDVKIRLLDLIHENKTNEPITETFKLSPDARSVQVSISGTGFEQFTKRFMIENNFFTGIDDALVSLYRSLFLRRYLTEKSKIATSLYKMSSDNITTAYQRLQFYNNYDGSYSFSSERTAQHPSLYLTSLAFGAMISPMMPFYDNMTLNRTLHWILSHQQDDGSFDDNGTCYYYSFCAGKFRRESLTALVLYSFTRDNSYDSMPEFIRSRLYSGENSPIMRAQRYLVSRVPDALPDFLTITLFEIAFLQNRGISTELRNKIHAALLSRKLTVVPEDGAKFIHLTGNQTNIEDESLLNIMTASLYTHFEDYKTSIDIARWIVNRIPSEPSHEKVLDIIFRTETWLQMTSVFGKRLSKNMFSVTIDLSTDNGEKKQLKLDSTNIDSIQRIEFTTPASQITYSVSGVGFFFIRFAQKFIEQQPKSVERTPFELKQEFKPMSWLSEITAKTCMTYTPTSDDTPLTKEIFNRTIAVEVEIPSGMRVNLRQIGFLLSRSDNVMHFTYDKYTNELIFFINVPPTMFGKSICLEWCLERLSTVMSWVPVKIHVFDYLRPNIKLITTVPIEFQPIALGYSFVEAVHKARPSFESLKEILHKGKEL